MKLSERLKEYRRIFQFSQEQLGEKLHVSRQVITKWENERGMPDIANLQAISELFHVSVDDLINDQKEMTYPLLKETIKLDKKGFSHRYDQVVAYLKKTYGTNASIYPLTELGKDASKLTKLINFITLGISDLSYISEWISHPTIWFLVETNGRSLLVKSIEDQVEINALHGMEDTDRFVYDHTELMKLKHIRL